MVNVLSLLHDTAQFRFLVYMCDAFLVLCLISVISYSGALECSEPSVVFSRVRGWRCREGNSNGQMLDVYV